MQPQGRRTGAKAQAEPDPNTPKVWIVVLNWNGRQWLDECLGSIANLSYPNYETLLVDNGSTDGSVQFAREAFPWVHILENKENLGFAEGNNRGIRLALANGADMILVLNNDTQVHADLLRQLVRTAVEANAAVVGASAYERESDHLQERGMACDIFGFPIPMRPSYDSADPHECFYVSGSCMLLAREFLLKGGGFDAQYFIFVEDLDICWRAWLLGYRVVVAPRATLWHEGGGTVSGGYEKSGVYETLDRRIYLRERNTIRTLLKNYSRVVLPVIAILYAVVLLFEWMIWLFQSRSAALALIRAVGWNILNIKDTFSLRRQIQLMRRRPDREILSRMEFSLGKWDLLKRVGIPIVIESMDRRP